MPRNSPKQTKASRENGAKSHGPVTPEGKLHSSRNALKHGLCARRLLLPDESPDDLRELEVHWMRQLQPFTRAERSGAEQVAFTDFLVGRYGRAEASLLSIEMEKHSGDPKPSALDS